jgi:hypothetical protein
MAAVMVQREVQPYVVIVTNLVRARLERAVVVVVVAAVVVVAEVVEPLEVGKS